MLDNYLLLDFLACLKFNLAGSASAAHNVYVASFGSGHALSLEVIEDFIGGLGGIGTLVDLITILLGSFRDNTGTPLRQ